MMPSDRTCLSLSIFIPYCVSICKSVIHRQTVCKSIQNKPMSFKLCLLNQHHSFPHFFLSNILSKIFYLFVYKMIIFRSSTFKRYEQYFQKSHLKIAKIHFGVIMIRYQSRHVKWKNIENCLNCAQFHFFFLNTD